MFRFVMAMPAGLRSQIPISHTPSKPFLAMAFHSAEGTELKSRKFPYFWLRSDSQTHVLISYNVGYRGQIGMVGISQAMGRYEGTKQAPSSLTTLIFGTRPQMFLRISL
jgi:hypothetical protein